MQLKKTKDVLSAKTWSFAISLVISSSTSFSIDQTDTRPQTNVTSSALVVTAPNINPELKTNSIPAVTNAFGLTLAELWLLVSDRNENLQMRMLEYEVSQRTLKAEKGIFEPSLVGSVDHTDSQRPNNTQQLANLGLLAEPQLNERNTIYEGGIDFLLPTGAKLRTGYTYRDLLNNLQKGKGPEYEMFAGATLIQPLLKNFGPAATLARIRLASIGSEIAFQEYRRQRMLVLAQAEAAYWDLYFMQEQQKYSGESVKTAEKILVDNRARMEVGRGAELDVLQAEAGLALRKTRLNQAGQKVYDGGRKLTSLYSLVSTNLEKIPCAIDQPQSVVDALSNSQDVQMAFQDNPDYRIRLRQAEQEKVRVRYTRNQRLPQLDAKGSYGFNALGTNTISAWDSVERAEYPAWTIGLEMRIPLGGGSKERNEYMAAKLNHQKSIVAIQEAETQILNAIDAARNRVQASWENIGSQQSVAQYHEKLLNAQMDKLSVGAIDSRTVLETEEKLFEARMAMVEILVTYRKALLDLELIRGSYLKLRNMEISPYQLRSKTEDYLRQIKTPKKVIDEFKQQAIADFETGKR